MLSVSPVSNVNFRSNSVDLSQPGKYTRTDMQPAFEQEVARPKKRRKFLKTLASLAVIGAGLVALPKIFPNAIKVLSAEEKAGAKLLQKVGHYLAVAGEKIGNYTYKPLMNLFKKGTPAA